ncbi:aldehyde dehydrogenase [Candidatus Dojkabacteria bacterium]|nr:aldehyde dehydrogenase [Candidatus Dojkabacteria bacterium]
MAKLISINPSTLEEVGSVNVSGVSDINRSVSLAKETFITWKELSLSDRIVAVKSLVIKFKEYKKELAETAAAEMGMPIRTALADVDDAVFFITEYCKSAKIHLCPKVISSPEGTVLTEYREPWGVVAAIIPWNYPVGNFIWACMQAVIAGNTVVVKHSELVSVFSTLLAKVVAESKIPEGVINFIYGDGKTGDQLTSQEIDMIMFTGSTAVGMYLAEKAAKKFIPIGLELGGSAPGIVFKDAALDSAVENIVSNRLTNSGQVCDGLKRLLVHESVWDKVVGELTLAFSQKRVGNALDKNTEIGPLVSETQYNLAVDQLNDAIKKGAQIAIGGPDYDRDGFFFKPTLVTNIKPNMRIWQEEVFAPILPVVPFSTVEEAIALANDTLYGLGAYVYTKDKVTAEQVASKIESGMVSINGVGYISPDSPFGGYKASGLSAREHGKYGFEHVTQTKVVAKPKRL